MKTENFSLPTASAVQIFHTRVRVVRYDEGSGTGTPTIRVRSLNTGELDVQMKPGRQIIMPQAVDGIIITNLTANPITGTVTIGAGDVSDNSLVGTVTLDAASLAALEAIDLNTASLATLRQPLQSTRNWSNTAAIVANTPLTVFTSGSNVNGAVLLSAGYQQAGSPTLPGPVFIMKNGAAPTSITDGEIVCCAAQFNEGSTTLCATAYLPAPVLVPPGFGLYLISADALTGLAANRPNLRHASWRDL